MEADVRISDHRYSRDRLRLDVALRFIGHEARTHTIRAWTGLTDDRIRKLYRSYLADPPQGPTRHRGKSPQRVAFFTRTPRLRAHSAVLASLYRLLGALPAAPRESGTTLRSLARAELLCQAFEAYRDVAGGEALISFEHAVFLLSALARADELVLGPCRECGALLVLDRFSLRAARCAPCEAETPGDEAQPQPGSGVPPDGLAAASRRLQDCRP
jgi:Flagellar transcriptional activator (FlhC)